MTIDATPLGNINFDKLIKTAPLQSLRTKILHNSLGYQQ